MRSKTGRMLLLFVLCGMLLFQHSCDAKSISVRELGTALMTQLLEELLMGSSPSAADRQQYAILRARAQLDTFALQLDKAIESGEEQPLKDWADEAAPELKPLLVDYSVRELRRGIRKLSPKFEETLRAALPQALAYVVEAHKSSSIRTLSSAGVEISEDERKLIGDLLVREWKKANTKPAEE